MEISGTIRPTELGLNMIFLRIEERVFERPLGFGSYCQLPHYCWPGTFVFGNCMWHVLHLTGLSVGVAGAGFGCDWHQHLAASTFVAFNYFFDMRMPPHLNSLTHNGLLDSSQFPIPSNLLAI